MQNSQNSQNTSNSLQLLLDRLYFRYHRVEFLGSDPLEFPHRYGDVWDQEAVALLSALLAYGNVKQIRRSVEEVLGQVGLSGESPRVFVRSLDPEKPEGIQRALLRLKSFVHRFNRGTDVVILFALLARSWRTHGSLGAHFMSHLKPGDSDITEALDGLINEWRQWIGSDAVLRKIAAKSPSCNYFFTSPRDGSCCKRWCMFLRWMGRREASQGLGQNLDLGLWAAGSEARSEDLSGGTRLERLAARDSTRYAYGEDQPVSGD